MVVNIEVSGEIEFPDEIVDDASALAALFKIRGVFDLYYAQLWTQPTVEVSQGLGFWLRTIVRHSQPRTGWSFEPVSGDILAPGEAYTLFGMKFRERAGMDPFLVLGLDTDPGTCSRVLTNYGAQINDATRAWAGCPTVRAFVVTPGDSEASPTETEQ